jgi:hypothetical protein
MSFSELIQNCDIFNDKHAEGMRDTRTLKVRSGKELHWPKLALGDVYPVTNRDGKVIRYEQVNGDLI